MNVREYAKSVGFTVVGKLRRMPDVHYGMDDNRKYPVWIDEAGNEYCGSYSKDGCFCIITSDGSVIWTKRGAHGSSFFVGNLYLPTKTFTATRASSKVLCGKVCKSHRKVGRSRSVEIRVEKKNPTQNFG